VRNPFTCHPRKHGMTYWYHLEYAMVLAMLLAGLAFVTAVHAVLPFAFEYTTSRTIARLHRFLSSRKPPQENSDGRTQAQVPRATDYQ